MKGRWYLVYKTMYDTDIPMGGFGSINYNTFEYEKDVEILLESTQKVGAISEAKKKWTKILKEANTVWEDRKKTSANPPKTAFEGADPDPHVIYKVNLLL